MGLNGKIGSAGKPTNSREYRSILTRCALSCALYPYHYINRNASRFIQLDQTPQAAFSSFTSRESPGKMEDGVAALARAGTVVDDLTE